MKFPLFLFALLHPLLSSQVANAERKLPIDVQVELLFPRDEGTYAPTQLFPIVFGIDNIDALWSVDVWLTVGVTKINLQNTSAPPGIAQSASLDFSEVFRQGPGKQFFHFPAVSVTNGTTGYFKITWYFSLTGQCHINSTNPWDLTETPLSRASISGSRHTALFRTVDGAPLPDVETAFSSCPELSEVNAEVVRVREAKKTYDDGQSCPIFEQDIEPTKCAFTSSAKELAANVSAAMLDEMGCEDGDWRTITAPCLKKEEEEENRASLRTVGFGVILVLLALAFAA